LVDAVEIVLGARPPACGHVVVGEDSLQIFPRADGVRGEACEPAHGGWREHDREIVCHDVGVSSSHSDSGGVSLQPLSWVHPSFIGLDSSDFETTRPLERSECPGECRGPFRAVRTNIGSVAGDDRLQSCVRVAVFLLVLLATSYFIFMAPETSLVDTPSCVPKIAEVHSGVLFDLLVVLAMMLGAVASNSPLGRW